MYESGSRYIEKMNGCQNIVIAWIAAYLPQKEGVDLMTRLIHRGWIDEKIK